MNLPELAIKRRVTTMMLIASLTVLGTVALFRLPLGFMPEFQKPELFVRVPYPSASPEQVERMIVRPIEETLGTVRGLRHIWAYCDQDGGMVGLQFDWSIDMRHARVEVWEKLDRVRRDLPDDLGDITVTSTWNAREAESPILEGRLSSPRDLSESYDLLERKIVRPLSRIPGVAQVRLDGVQPQQVRINLRVPDLAHHQASVREIARILRSSNFDRSLGKVRTTDRRLTLRMVGTLTSLDEIRELPIRADGLRLKDVADVVYEEPPLEYGRHLDGNFAIGITVSQEANANTVDVGAELERRIESMSRDPELEGVNFLVWFSQGREITKTLQDLALTGFFGSLLALVVLFGFLRRVSATVVSILCIPFSLLVTCGIVWVQGKSMNTLTLLGLIVGVGMLVDNAVVVMENIFRHVENGEDRVTASRLGASQVTVAITAATLTSVIVFLPLIFSKPSELNVILQEIALTICVTLLASLFISQTLIPLATAWFIKAKPQRRGRVMSWLEGHYRTVLQLNLRHRWVTALVGIAVFASAYYPFSNIDTNFDTNRSDMFAQVKYDVSGPLTLAKREALCSKVEAALEPHRKELMARSIYSFWNDRFQITRVYLEEGKANEENIRLVRKRLKKLLPELPGVRLGVAEQARFWRPDAGKKVAFQLVGDDSEVLAELAKEARTRLESIDGLFDSFSAAEDGSPELHVVLDRERLASYDVAPSRAAEVVGLTYRGRRLPRYRTPAGEREMWILLGEQKVESLSQLRDLNVEAEDGQLIPLASFSEFSELRGPRRIQRDGRLTSVWVGASYETGTKDDYLPRVEAAMAGMEFPYGYRWTFGRWKTEKEEKSQEFVYNLLLALLLIFALMAGLFESVLQAVGLMIALPFALSGAAWCLWMTGTDFDQPAAIGLLLLIGIVVNNGIVMVEHINMYRREGMPRHEAMLKGGQERLRPVLMTAMTTLLGLMPMVIQKPALAGVYYYSMALVIMGGLVVSTFLTTLLLPTTICLVEDSFAFVVSLPGRLRDRWIATASAR